MEIYYKNVYADDVGNFFVLVYAPCGHRFFEWLLEVDDACS